MGSISIPSGGVGPLQRPGDEKERIVRQLGAANSVIQTVEDAAAVLGKSVADTRAILTEYAAEIEQAVRRAELAGEHLPALARACLSKILAKISAELDTADGVSAAELSKPVLRFLENHERVQLAKRETENLPLVHITFINQTMRVRVLDEGGPPPASDVIDVIGRAPEDGGDRATP